MPRALPDQAARRLRLAAQRLTRPHADVSELVRHLVGVQAQDVRASRLALRARSAGLTVGAVRQACDLDRSLVRTWAMRGTLHMLAADDVRWIVGLLGPRAAARQVARRRSLGLTERVEERALRAVRAALGDGPMTRPELIAVVRRRRVPIEGDGQAGAHLVMLAALRGLVVRGPDTALDEPTFVLADDWIHRSVAVPADPTGELAFRYLAAHGPATPADFASWSGLAAGAATRAFARVGEVLEEVELSSGRAWLPRGAVRFPAASGARLLGAFDGLLLGYRDRSLVVDGGLASRVVRGGMVAPVVLIDGRVVATWRLARDGMSVVPDAGVTGIEREVADVRRFLCSA